MSRINIPHTTDLRTLVRQVYGQSIAIGMGHLHYRPGCLTDHEIDGILNNSRRQAGSILSMDYVNGRACKFHINVDRATGQWSTSSHWFDHTPEQLKLVLSAVGCWVEPAVSVEVEYLPAPPDLVVVPTDIDDEPSAAELGRELQVLIVAEQSAGAEVSQVSTDDVPAVSSAWEKHAELYERMLASKPSLASSLKQHYDPQALVESPVVHVQTKYDKLVKLARKNGIEV